MLTPHAVLVNEIFSTPYHAWVMCTYSARGNSQMDATWIFGITFEVVALCLALWVAIKHFCDLRRASIGWTTGDCFEVLMKTHALYFVA